MVPALFAIITFTIAGIVRQALAVPLKPAILGMMIGARIQSGPVRNDITNISTRFLSRLMRPSPPGGGSDRLCRGQVAKLAVPGYSYAFAAFRSETAPRNQGAVRKRLP